MNKPLTVALAGVLGLLSALLTAPPSEAAPDRMLFERTASLTTSVAGLPAPGSAPGARITSFDVRVQYDEKNQRANLFARGQMSGPSPGWPGVRVTVGVGTFNGTTCQVGNVLDSTRYAARPTDDRSIVLAELDFPYDIRPNCAVAVSADWDSGQVQDAKVAPLQDVWLEAGLRAQKVTMLGSKQKRLELVRGVTQLHQLQVTNPGSYRAVDVRITGAGKGVKVKPVTITRIDPGDTFVPYVAVTLKGRQKRSRVRFTVTGSGVTDTITVPVRRIRPPARPANGRWAGGTFSFRVTKGRITSFRGHSLEMECRTPGAYPTKRTVSLSFPTTKVPRHGYVQATTGESDGGVAWSAKLTGYVSGNRFRRGTFAYATGNCWVNASVTAKRVGR